jgi:hypothetical protein
MNLHYDTHLFSPRRLLVVLAMRTLTVGLACAMWACLPAHAFASVGAGDVAATRVYLRASDAYVRSAYSAIGVIAVAVEVRASAIAGECPSVLTYAPRDRAFAELGEEAVLTARFAGAASLHPMMLRLAHAIEHLRWSNRRLTRLVRAEVAEERALVTLALPDVCSDILAWKASKYAALPPSAASFVAHMQAIESLSVGLLEESREAVIMRLLKPYETSAGRRTARRVERLEAMIGKRLGAVGTNARKKLAAAFGVPAL